jgi:hypothetical protein
LEIPYENSNLLVMAGLVPAIHVLGVVSNKVVDARDEPGHDAERFET